jgi:hypothetical protein
VSIVECDVDCVHLFLVIIGCDHLCSIADPNINATHVHVSTSCSVWYMTGICVFIIVVQITKLHNKTSTLVNFCASATQ